MPTCRDPDTFAQPIAVADTSLLANLGRRGLFVMGGISFAIGAIGLVLPLLPTTIFWIIAAWAWSKSCPRLQQRLYAMPGAGPHVRAWIEEGRINRRGKQFALGGLTFGLAMTTWALYASPVILAVAGLPQIVAGFYIASRPE